MELENILQQFLSEKEVPWILNKNSEEYNLEYVFNSLTKEEQATLANSLIFCDLIVLKSKEDLVSLLLDWYYPELSNTKVFGFALENLIDGNTIIKKLCEERELFLLPNGTYLYVYSEALKKKKFSYDIPQGIQFDFF